MGVYVSLLRGINVGGSKVILMDDLKKVFEKLGFSKVKTLIQSGNVVFVAEKKNPSMLQEMIRDGIRNRFKFDVEVLVFSLDEFEKIVEKNPFDERKLKSSGRIHLTMLFEKPHKERVAAFYEAKNNVPKESVSDDFEVIGSTVYTLCRNGWAKSPFSGSVILKFLKVDATTRNLDTMKKLVEIGKNI